jgi:hypothetical protein
MFSAIITYLKNTQRAIMIPKFIKYDKQDQQGKAAFNERHKVTKSDNRRQDTYVKVWSVSPLGNEGFVRKKLLTTRWSVFRPPKIRTLITRAFYEKTW